MTTEIRVEQKTANRLAEQAAASGLSMEDYLLTLLDSAEVPPVEPISLPPQERAKAFLEWAASHHSSAPPLSDEAISRESIYTREDEQL